LPLNNLLRPPHRSRFFFALAAGIAALVIYLSADHFKVVPGISALDDSAPPEAGLGPQSVLVVPMRTQCANNVTFLLGLEIIRALQRSAEIEVIAPHSALALVDSEQLGENTGSQVDTGWILNVGCDAAPEGDELFADLTNTPKSEGERLMEQPFTVEFLQTFTRHIAGTTLDRMGSDDPAIISEFRQPDPAAYLKFLQARFFLLIGGTGIARANQLLEEVVEVEPEWPSGLAAYAYSLLLEADSNPVNDNQVQKQAETSLSMALQLQPDHPESHLYRSLIAHRFEWQWQQAYDSARLALDSAPGNAQILAAASTAAFTLGRFEEGIELIRKAIPLDPLVLSHRLKYGLMLEFSGQYQAAIDAYRELMTLNPEYPAVRAYLGRTLVVAGRAEAALPHMEIETTPFWKEYGMVLVSFALERDQEAQQRLDTLIELHAQDAAMQIAEIHAYIGRNDEAFEWLELAVQQRDPGLSELIGNPLLLGLVNDPRWDELLARLGLEQPE